MRSLTNHRHPEQIASARMIEKYELFDGARIELAIFAELQRDLRHPVRLARRIDAKGVGFSFGHPHSGIDHGGQEEKHRGKDQREKRQAGGIRDSAYAPALAPFIDRALEEKAERREAEKEEDAEISDELDVVIQAVGTHFVGHYPAKFRQGAIPPQI